MRHIYTFIALLLFSFSTYAQWYYEGGHASSGFARYQSFAFHPQTAIPFAAFMDGGNAPASVVTRSGFSWSNVGPAQFTNTFSAAISMEFNPLTNEPYMVYSDNSNLNKSTVRKWDGTSWTLVGSAGFTAGGTAGHDLLFKPGTDTPYIAFKDYGLSEKCVVMKYNGSSWVYVGAQGFSSGQVGTVHMEFHPITLQPWVIFVDFANGQVATVMRFDGNSWQTVGGVGISPGLASGVDIAFHPQTAEPYIVYNDLTNSGSTVQRWDGSNWVNVGSAGFTPSYTPINRIAFHPGTNEPYIAFKDDNLNDRLSVMRFDGSSWQYVGNPGISQDIADYIDIKFQPGTNKPFVIFQDKFYSYKTAIMRFDAPCVAPDQPILHVNNTSICSGEMVQISVDTSSSLNGATSWNLYTSACGLSLDSSNANGIFNVIPDSTLTYYVRGEGCAIPGNCDSITIQVLPNYSVVLLDTICSGDTYQFPDGSVQDSITTPMQYSSSLLTLNNCDSIVTIDIHLYPRSFENDTQYVCPGGNLSMPDGLILTNILTDQFYTSSLTNKYGCDSLIQTTILIDTIDYQIEHIDASIQVYGSFDSIQWINCQDLTPLAGETNSTLIPADPGTYAVILYAGNCVDTTYCSYAGYDAVFSPNNSNIQIELFPNPARSTIFIKSELVHPVEIKIFDLTGKVMLELSKSTGLAFGIDVEELGSGVYVLQISDGERVATRKFSVE